MISEKSASENWLPLFLKGAAVLEAFALQSDWILRIRTPNLADSNPSRSLL